MAASQPAPWCARPAQVRTHSNQPSRRWWRKVFLCVRGADVQHGTVFPDARKRTQMAGTVFRCTWAVHVRPEIPARGCLFSVRIGCTCARTYRTCGLFPHCEERNFSAALYGDFCPSPRNGLIAASSRNGKNSTLACKPKPAKFIQQRFCYCVTGWLWQGRQRSGRRRTGRIG